MPSLGDAIYCRPFVKAFASSVSTQWPDLYSDLEFPGGGEEVAPRYDSKSLAIQSIPRAIGRFFPRLEDVTPDLPPFEAPREYKRYAVIRPPTLRERFYAPARNPLMEYIHQAVEVLKGGGFTTVGVGNVSDSEVFHGEPPNVDFGYWLGLSIPRLMGFLEHASVIVGGPGYTVPAAIAYGVPHIIIYGGAGRWNTLDKLTDPSMNHKLETIEPDRFCKRCKDVKHDCDKTITGFREKFTNALNRAVYLR